MHYTLKVSTSHEHPDSQSDGWFYGAALGYNGELVDFGLTDNAGINDFEAGNTDTFEFDSDVDLGKIGCVIIRAGDKSDDAWMIHTVSIFSDTDDGFEAEYVEDHWLSSDTSNYGDAAELALMFCDH